MSPPNPNFMAIFPCPKAFLDQSLLCLLHIKQTTTPTPLFFVYFLTFLHGNTHLGLFHLRSLGVEQKQKGKKKPGRGVLRCGFEIFPLHFPPSRDTKWNSPIKYSVKVLKKFNFLSHPSLVLFLSPTSTKLRKGDIVGPVATCIIKCPSFFFLTHILESLTLDQTFK